MKFSSGLPETACGQGSTLEFTSDIRDRLPVLFETIDIWSILDLGCGDLNWMSQVDLDGIDYHGIDEDEDNIAAAICYSADMNAEHVSLLWNNIFDCEWPETDLVICRDLFQHLPHDDVGGLLDAISGRWLLATSHDVEMNRIIQKRGGFRRLNLEKDPFCLPEPHTRIPDGDGRFLCLWWMP